MQQSATPPETRNPTISPSIKPTGERRSAPAAAKASGGLLWIVILVLVAGGIGFLVWRAKSHAKAAAAMGKRADTSIPITPGKVVQKEVAIYYDGLGTVQAFNTVTVRPRVDGQLIKVAFTEGQDVHASN